MNPLEQLLPPRARALIYAIVWIVGVLLVAVQTAVGVLLTAGALEQQPVALTVALAVYAVLSAPSAALARANVTPPSSTPGSPPAPPPAARRRAT